MLKSLLLLFKNPITTNTLVQIVGKIITTASSLGIAFLIGRFLGAEFYGDFTKVFATTTFLFMMLDFGLNAVVVRRLTHSSNKPALEFRHLFGTRLLAAAILYLLLISFLLIAPTTSNTGYTSLVKLSIAIFGFEYFTQAVFLSANSIFQKNLKYLYSVIASSIGGLIKLTLVLLLVINQATLFTVVAAHFLGSLAMADLTLLFVRRFVNSIVPIINLSKISRLVRTASPIGLTLVLNLFATKSDTILLTFMRPTQEVGFYGLSRRIFDVVLVFPTFFMNAAYPIFLTKLHKNHQSFKSVFNKSLIILLGSAFLGLLTLVIAAPLITVIRPEFAPSIITLKILALSLPLFFVSSLLLWTTIAMGKQQYLVKVYSLALVVNLAANLFGIPRVGYLAPAIATGITEALILLLLIKPVFKSLKRYE